MKGTSAILLLGFLAYTKAATSNTEDFVSVVSLENEKEGYVSVSAYASCARDASSNLCKCESADALGAACGVCKSDSACDSVRSQCRRSGVVEEKANGWCVVKDRKINALIDGTAHLDLSFDSLGKGAMQVFKKNRNGKYFSLYSCDMDKCRQEQDRKNGRIFTKCLEVTGCQATCSEKKDTGLCGKVKSHFREVDSRGGWGPQETGGKMKFVCKDNACQMIESYGLLPEMSVLKTMDCEFSECVIPENGKIEAILPPATTQGKSRQNLKRQKTKVDPVM